jgi:precorrin-2 dehydrogenase/sirohydrochlorin ferrochelatase
LLNVADKPEFCDFYLGGVVTKGDLKIGISTNGKSPILAKRLRETFEEILPPSLEETIASTNLLRKKLHGNFEEKLKTLNELTKDLKV